MDKQQERRTGTGMECLLKLPGGWITSNICLTLMDGQTLTEIGPTAGKHGKHGHGRHFSNVGYADGEN